MIVVLSGQRCGDGGASTRQCEVTDSAMASDGSSVGGRCNRFHKLLVSACFRWKIVCSLNNLFQISKNV